MKRLIALLSACAVITCAFASCGKEEEEKSSDKSVSVSETETPVPTTKEKTTEEVTTEETTEAETTTTTEPTTEEKTTQPTTEKSVNDVVGMWYYEDEGLTMILNVKDDGYIDLLVDVTELSHFTADGGMFLGGDILDSDCIDYDGKSLIVTVNGQEGFNMTKDSGDAEVFDGEYTLNSGIMYDNISEDGSYDIGIIINGEVMFSAYKDMLSYTIDDGVVSLAGLVNLDYDFDTADVEYKISGDTLTLIDAEDDSDMILKKFDLENYKPSVNNSTEVAVSNKNSENEISESDYEISDIDIATGGDIVGAWLSQEDSSYGFNFREDQTCGVLADSTEVYHFTTDGKFVMSDMTIESDGITNDGTTVSVNLVDNDILTMKRNDGNNSGGFDGSYTIVSGALYDGMVESMCESFGVDEETATIYAVIKGDKMYIELANVMEYATLGNLIILDGLESFDVPSGAYVEYEVSGNTLTIFDEDGTESEVFYKIEL